MVLANLQVECSTKARSSSVVMGSVMRHRLLGRPWTALRGLAAEPAPLAKLISVLVAVFRRPYSRSTSGRPTPARDAWDSVDRRGK
jgi:hypothetical protein